MPASSRDREIDRLFELTPEEFTAARDRLAKDLKAQGDTEGAGTVKALRRPTLAAWTVNQAIRQNPASADALLRVGDDLRKAQRRALSGVAGGGLREATDARRKAVRALLKAAEEILNEGGRASAGTVEAIQATLEAGAIDEKAGRLLRSARLTKEFPPPAGFGDVEGLALVPAPKEPARSMSSKRSAASSSKRGRDRNADKERDASRMRELRAERDQAQRQARDLERDAEAARKEGTRAGQAAVKAQEEAERAQRAAEEAIQAARRLAAAARQAGAEASRAEREADRAKRFLEQVKERLAGAR
jgi:hypothetical protein